jgi:SAM-dependent methyltransferase
VTAIRQPLGNVQLVSETHDPFIFNSSHAPNLIKYDKQYCTTASAVNGEYLIPTLDYIGKILRRLTNEVSVVDIGCGQGEFVTELARQGVKTTGFDPVLRHESPILNARFWQEDDPQADLYVMRCVLPHIINPWAFLAKIAESSPESLVLIEFQRLEWVIQNRIWYQICHDHVNLFTLADFESRYKVIDSGTFSFGEWGWVLIKPSSFGDLKNEIRGNEDSGIEDLLNQKEIFLQNIDAIQRPIIIWGSAGKGIVLTHSLSAIKEEIYAIDSDKNRWNLYLEGSGVKVQSPIQGLASESHDSLILVCNPNHLSQVKDFVDGRFEVILPSDLITN